MATTIRIDNECKCPNCSKRISTKQIAPMYVIKVGNPIKTCKKCGSTVHDLNVVEFIELTKYEQRLYKMGFWCEPFYYFFKKGPSTIPFYLVMWLSFLLPMWLILLALPFTLPDHHKKIKESIIRTNSYSDNIEPVDFI